MNLVLRRNYFDFNLKQGNYTPIMAEFDLMKGSTLERKISLLVESTNGYYRCNIYRIIQSELVVREDKLLSDIYNCIHLRGKNMTPQNVEVLNEFVAICRIHLEAFYTNLL